MAELSGSEPEYYHAVAVHALEALLRDEAHSKLHLDATLTLTRIGLSLGAKCALFIG